MEGCSGERGTPSVGCADTSPAGAGEAHEGADAAAVAFRAVSRWRAWMAARRGSWAVAAWSMSAAAVRACWAMYWSWAWCWRAVLWVMVVVRAALMDWIWAAACW